VGLPRVRSLTIAYLQIVFTASFYAAGLLPNLNDKKRFGKLHKPKAPSERELSPQGD
jgi:hypothetical protein